MGTKITIRALGRCEAELVHVVVAVSPVVPLIVANVGREVARVGRAAVDAIERWRVVLDDVVVEEGPRGLRFHVGLVHPHVHLLAGECVHCDVLDHETLVADVVSSAWRVSGRVADPVLLGVAPPAKIPGVPRRRLARVGGCGHLGLVLQPHASRPRINGRGVSADRSLRECAKGAVWVAGDHVAVALPFVQGRRVVDVAVGPVFVPGVARQVGAQNGGPVYVQPVARQLPPSAAAVSDVVAMLARALVHVAAAAERARIAVIVASVAPADGANVVVPDLEGAQVDLDLLRPGNLARGRGTRERVAGFVGVGARDQATRPRRCADLRVHVDQREPKVPVFQNQAPTVAEHALQRADVGLNVIDAQ